MADELDVLRTLELREWRPVGSKRRPFPDPPDGWRKIAPVNTIGYPMLASGYQNDLIELAGDAVKSGVTLTGTFTQVDGLWYPIPESLLVTN